MPRRLPGRGPALTVAAPPESRRPREVVLAAVERAVLAQRVVAYDDGAGADARERAAARVGHRPLRAARRGGGVAPARAEVALDVREQAAPSRGRSRAAARHAPAAAREPAAAERQRRERVLARLARREHRARELAVLEWLAGARRGVEGEGALGGVERRAERDLRAAVERHELARALQLHA